jgi:aryl-alcohol dehydrogenase-like predicted oxidoreductase
LQGIPELVDAKRACRLSLGAQLDEKAEAEPEQVLRELQQCIDAGFQTFQFYNNHNTNNNDYDQLKWIAKLRQAMPRYVKTHWTLRFEMPTVDTTTTTGLTPTSIRQQVVDLLDRTKSDAIDTFLLQYSSSLQHALYHLDVLGTLTDLQRQGYIRSIGVENWPSALIRQAQRCGLRPMQQRLSLVFFFWNKVMLNGQLCVLPFSLLVMLLRRLSLSVLCIASILPSFDEEGEHHLLVLCVVPFLIQQGIAYIRRKERI